MILNHLETVLLQKGLSVSGEWNVSPANGRWDLVEERLISEGAASVWGALFEEIQEPFFSFPCRRPEPGKYLVDKETHIRVHLEQGREGGY